MDTTYDPDDRETESSDHPFISTNLPPNAPAPPAPPSHGSQPPSSARNGGRDVPLIGVLAVSLLSAVLASAGTVALVQPRPVATSSAPPAATTTSQTSTSKNANVTIDASDAIVAVAANVSPAVVTITSSGVDRSGFFQIPATGVGSGVIFDSSGLILTNWHVVEGANQLTVTLKDETELDGTVVASDPDHDLAVVKVNATNLPAAGIGSSNGLQVGQLVIAIGSPLGTFTDSVTSGILSATGRSITVRDASTRQARKINDLLQTDAAINEGNSGGPLLDATGKVIGINTATASSAEGIGFAIPIDEAASILAKARNAPATTP